MTLQDWTPLYSRLCASMGRKETPAQLRAYYDALNGFSTGIVTEAVRIAGSRTWAPTHPHTGDIAEICNGIRRAHATPASTCDVCHGDKFTITQCDGWHSVNGEVVPVNRQALCRRDFPHAKHEDAHCCYQCHPAARRTDDAA